MWGLRFAACALVLVSATASAKPRLSPALSFVADGRMPAHMLPHLADGSLRVFVRFGGSADALRRAGIRPYTHAGDWWTAAVRPETLATLPDGIYVGEAHELHTLLDQSAVAAGAVAARAADPTFDGRGVVVGIVDTGIDFTHDDFRHPDGTTRIKFLQDLSNGSGGTHPEMATAPDAQVWTGDDLNRAIVQRAGGLPTWPAVLERDIFGHGTHCAGIAAGSGRATGAGFPAGRYVGMAPGADLVIVKDTRGNGNGFSDADIADGVAFVFARAEALGEPAVVNLSLGAQSTGHVGHSNMEDLLAAMVGAGKAGRVIVAAAGNDGSGDIHASGAMIRRTEATIPIDVGEYLASQAANTSGFGWEVWTPGEDHVAVSVRSPGGIEYGPVVWNQRADWDTVEGHIYISNAQGGTDMASGRNGAYCTVQHSIYGLVASGRWEIILRGRTSRYDLWMSGSSLPSTVEVRGEIDADDHLTIPATNEDIIAVASFTTKNTWTSFLHTHVLRTVTVGLPSLFSSTGPTADGRFKPDLAAPGEFITSTLSADALPTQNASAFHTTLRTLWADDGVHGILRGTSMACPHVVGAVALIFQKRPDFDTVQVKELLRATARGDDFVGTGPLWSPKWGFGKLAIDIFARVLAGEQPKAVDASVSAVGVSRDVIPPNAGDESVSVVTVVPKDASGLPLGGGHDVTIDATAGHWEGPAEQVSEFGRWERRLRADVLGRTAKITVRVDGVALARQPTIAFVDSRIEFGVPFDRGCAVAGRGAHGSWLLLLPLIVYARRRGGLRWGKRSGA